MSQKSLHFFCTLVGRILKKMKQIFTIVLFLCCLGMTLHAQNTEENLTRFQEEHQALQNAVQQQLAQIEADYEKEVSVITKEYKKEITKLQVEYKEAPAKNPVVQKKYKKEAGKINSKYELKTKDVIFKSTIKKAKVENAYYHDRNKLMVKYNVYIME